MRLSRLLFAVVVSAGAFATSAHADCVIRGESVGHLRVRPEGLRADLSIRAVPASITLDSRRAARVDLRVEGELAFVAPVRLSELRVAIPGVTRAASIVSVGGDSARVRWTDEGTSAEREVRCAELELVGHEEPPVEDAGCLVERALHGGRFVEVRHAVARTGASVYARSGGRGRWASVATSESIRVLDLPGDEWLPIMNLPGLGGLSDPRGTSSHGWIRRDDLTLGVHAERGLTLVETPDGLRVDAAPDPWHGFGLRAGDVITSVVDAEARGRATQLGALTLGQRTWRVPGTRVAYIRDLIGRGEAVIHVSRGTREETVTVPAAPAAQEACPRVRRGCGDGRRLW